MGFIFYPSRTESTIGGIRKESGEAARIMIMIRFQEVEPEAEPVEATTEESTEEKVEESVEPTG